jgi:hypothetical protein
MVETSVLNDKPALNVRIKDYACTKVDLFNRQHINAAVPYIIFQRLNYTLFFEHCVSYTAGKLKNLFSDYPDPKWLESTRPFQGAEVPGLLKASPFDMSAPTEIPLEFRNDFSNIKIIEGAIQFSRSLREMNRDMVFTIYNPFLRAEYDSIKAYFAKKLGRTTFNVKAQVKMGGERS